MGIGRKQKVIILGERTHARISGHCINHSQLRTISCISEKQPDQVTFLKSYPNVILTLDYNALKNS